MLDTKAGDGSRTRLPPVDIALRPAVRAFSRSELLLIGRSEVLKMSPMDQVRFGSARFELEYKLRNAGKSFAAEACLARQQDLIANPLPSLSVAKPLHLLR